MNYTFSGRYSDLLQDLLDELGATEELSVKFEDDWSGFVDVSVLLKDGRVFSYNYYYGSCSGCDGWESDGLSDTQIKDQMKQEATFFDNIEQYKIFESKRK